MNRDRLFQDAAQSLESSYANNAAFNQEYFTDLHKDRLLWSTMTERKTPKRDNFFPENPFKSHDSIDQERVNMAMDQLQNDKNIETLNQHLSG